MMRSQKRSGRSWSWAACAVAVATVVSPACSEARDDTVEQIQRYCNSSWQRAGIARQDWEDCTQEAVLELLARIGASQLPLAITEPESSHRRELKRCVWSTSKRWQRAARRAIRDRLLDLPEKCEPADAFPCSWNELLAIAHRKVSSQQYRILLLSSDGWAIPQIAEELKLSPIQVSRAKHKALRRIRDLVPTAISFA